MSKKIVYGFKDYPDLHFYDGKFWLNDLPCRKVYNSGTIQIRRGKFSVGLKKLKKQSYKTTIEVIECPF